MKRVAITTKDFHYANQLIKELIKDKRIEKIVVIGKDLTIPVIDKIVYIDTLPYFPLSTILKENEVDTIVNFMKIDDDTYSSKEAYNITLQSLKNIMSSGIRAGVKDFILYSSAVVYGVNKKKKLINFEPERLKKAGSKFYYSKLRFESEKIAYEYMDEFPDLNIKIARTSFTLGANINNLISSYLSLKFIPMVTHYNPEYQFVHENDVVRAFHYLIFNGKRGIYNISPDDSISLKEISEIMGHRLVSFPKIIAKQIAFLSWHTMPKVLKIPPYSLDFFMYSVLINNQTLLDTGFKFQYTTEETIKAFKKFKEHF